jgi:hypothetical protein
MCWVRGFPYSKSPCFIIFIVVLHDIAYGKCKRVFLNPLLGCRYIGLLSALCNTRTSLPLAAFTVCLPCKKNVYVVIISAELNNVD